MSPKDLAKRVAHAAFTGAVAPLVAAYKLEAAVASAERKVPRLNCAFSPRAAWPRWPSSQP